MDGVVQLFILVVGLILKIISFIIFDPVVILKFLGILATAKEQPEILRLDDESVD